jgi:hypothetical protein
MNINFVCVYKTGKIYTPEYVQRLGTAIGEHFPREHTFTVMTDDPASFGSFLVDRHSHQYRDIISLVHGWPGYWSKLELFRPNAFMFGNFMCYMDLDTIPRDNLGFISAIRCDITPLKFHMLRDWLAPDYFNSSVMCWISGYFDHLYLRFTADPESYMREYKKYPEKWGDQSFIQNHLGFIPTALQAEYPGKFVSFKANTTDQKCAASVVCFHGRPRPHEVHWAATAPFPGG